MVPMAPFSTTAVYVNSDKYTNKGDIYHVRQNQRAI